jgi:hypothetical protein
VKPKWREGDSVLTPLGRCGRVTKIFQGAKVTRYQLSFDQDYVELYRSGENNHPARFTFAREILLPEWMLVRA